MKNITLEEYNNFIFLLKKLLRDEIVTIKQFKKQRNYTKKMLTKEQQERITNE